MPRICEALQYAHEEGIVHRDIKPENILVDKKGRVKIADFGIAKLVRRTKEEYTLTGPWQVMGTLHYMAPEQMDNPLAVDHRADIYSLGVVFYEMLTGQLPLGRFPPPSQKAAVDVRLDEVVLRALEHEPDRRYQHASEMKTEVEAITRESPRQAAEPTAVPRAVARPANPTAPLSTVEEIDLRVVRSQVKGPAIGLLVTGLVHTSILPLICLAFTIIGALTGGGKGMRVWSGQGPIPLFITWNSGSIPLASVFGLGTQEIILTFGSTVMGSLIIVGALRMRNLASYGLAMTSCILAVLPCEAGWLLGLPMGIWALTVLTKPEVKAAFQLIHEKRRRSSRPD